MHISKKKITKKEHTKTCILNVSMIEDIQVVLIPVPNS